MIPLNRFHNYHVTSSHPGCNRRRQVIFQPSGLENTNMHVPSSAACKFAAQNTAPRRVEGADFVKAARVDVQKSLSRLLLPRLLLYPNKRDNGSDGKQGHSTASRWEAAGEKPQRAAQGCGAMPLLLTGDAPQGEGNMRPSSDSRMKEDGRRSTCAGKVFQPLSNNFTGAIFCTALLHNTS